MTCDKLVHLDVDVPVVRPPNLQGYLAQKKLPPP